MNSRPQNSNGKKNDEMAEKRIPLNAPSFHQQKRGPGAPRDDQEDEIDSFLDDLGEDDVAMMMPPDEDMAVDLGEAGRNWTRPQVPETFDAMSSPLSELLTLLIDPQIAP